MNSNQKWPEHLVIVRHAESMRNVQKQETQSAGLSEYSQGTRDLDVDLTDRGIEQASLTGQYLKDAFECDVTYVSPYQRTRRTER